MSRPGHNHVGGIRREFTHDEVALALFEGTDADELSSLGIHPEANEPYMIKREVPSFGFINPFHVAVRVLVTHNGGLIRDQVIQAAEKVWVTSQEMTDVGIECGCGYKHGSVAVTFNPVLSLNTLEAEATALVSLESLILAYRSDVKSSGIEVNAILAGLSLSIIPSAIIEGIRNQLDFGSFFFHYGEEAYIRGVPVGIVITDLFDLFEGGEAMDIEDGPLFSSFMGHPI